VHNDAMFRLHSVSVMETEYFCMLVTFCVVHLLI
jgi:hypothetical protein